MERIVSFTCDFSWKRKIPLKYAEYIRVINKIIYANGFCLGKAKLSMVIKNNPKLSPYRAIKLFPIQALLVFFNTQKLNNTEKPKLPDIARKILPMVLDLLFQKELPENWIIKFLFFRPKKCR